jgi:peptidylprolyl isomerase
MVAVTRPRPDTLPSESTQESFARMKFSALVLLAGTGAIAAGAQTKPAQPVAKPATTVHSTSSITKLPPGIPVVHGIIKPMFTLRYQDYKIGTGPVAETNKVYHVLYTGYLASTGEKFDSSDEHRSPLMKDGKPVMGPDGKPQMGEPQPLIFPQGYGRLIPGFDQGVGGMHVGGKRRIFIPWQLAYGNREMPARAGHPGIPAKSDLIFDVELVDVTDMPQMPQRPMGMPPHPGAPGAPAQPAKPGAPPTPPSGTAPATPPVANAPAKPGEQSQRSFPTEQPAASQQSAPASGTQQPQSK